MKTAQEYFDEYAISHQNETNQAIHYICVPLIFFSVIGLLMSIPTTFLENTLGLYNPLIENWAVVVTVVISIFYLRLGFWYFAEMLFVILLSIIGNFWISNNFNLFYVSIAIFVLAWIGQFYGHKVEGAKPSFLKDLEFLLIGPLWVIQKLGKKPKKATL
ncbi:DUF962 domain-containing protein [Polaribacter vadi]|uniref:Mpo1 family 2-hydroxy fatty acid dioxygenase n=1 Tax=Polaribacter TaxID=52959 RepID=UPI001C0A5549|nr:MULTISPECIES: Mpo1-like protein [Polaribacter]MBU3011895.1 DUF962 domain-containing protein [Polaribacter vadi]MDO6741709.1 DUF962 domain-containing protein [Polaribacter sp. 1_MG-2023]